MDNFKWSDLTLASELHPPPTHHQWEIAINGEYIDVELRRKGFLTFTRLVNYATIKNSDENFENILEAMHELLEDEKLKKKLK